MLKRLAPAMGTLRGSETGKAVGLAGAMIVNNGIALVAAVVFARMLSDYGALAALVSYLLILTVVGQALQVATARDGVLGRLGHGADLVATLERWGWSLGAFALVATVASILLRQPIADLVGVPHQQWAAAAGIPAGCAYLAVSIMRGALQATGDYRVVGISLIGEQTIRLIAGAVLAVIGLKVTGAFLGSLIAYIAMTAYCMLRLRERLGVQYTSPRGVSAFGLWHHVRAAAVAIAALGIIQFLQNIDLIIAKHQFSNPVASSYAVAAVAAKVVIWVAMGAGFYLVPETSRRRATGADTRPVLLRSVAIIVVCAVPCLLIFAVAAHPLLEIVFGRNRAIASSSLLPLGAAFSVLAGTYLAVQYMLALHRSRFLIAIGLVAVLEPVLLLQAPTNPAGFATVVLAVQVLGAVLAFGLALRPVRTARAAVPEAPPAAPPPVLQAAEPDRSA
jgi:O-antigen/teichoic acid export membrane protein